jgi:hypothetical protein
MGQNLAQRHAALAAVALPARRRRVAACALALAALGACEKKPVPGMLRVVAPGEGQYEIYRIANETPLQFVSEQSGKFNEDVPLPPGSYLVLADCSSESVIIYPGSTEKLIAHRIEFRTPHPPGGQDSFSIQCSRSDKTKSRQHLMGHYALNLLHGKRDLLVGMVPLHVDFTTTEGASTTPQTVAYELAALQVADFEGNTQDVSYFVSPEAELIAATKYQRFGHWEFLLPGRYGLEVNGTRMQVELKAREERIVRPALFKVTTSQSVDLDLPARIRGSPWLVEVNSEHWLNFNEIYPVLPGPATVAVSGSTRVLDVTFVEGETLELKARSVTVDSHCPAGDTACLGERAVSLSLPNEPYPFLESVSDVPILFIDEDQKIQVGVEGSRDIAYEVADHVVDKKLELGFVHLVPQPVFRPGQVTDLTRVDAAGAPLSGHTLDLNLEKPTRMPLVAGTYTLSQFVTITTIEGERRNNTRTFTVEPGKTLELEFPVFLSERKWSAMRKSRPVPVEGPDGGAPAKEGKATKPETPTRPELGVGGRRGPNRSF